MIDKRKEALKAYVKSIILDKEIMLLSLNGDASFRRYFRVADTSYIAVDAPPQTQKNQEFIQIDEALASSKVKVLKIIAYDLEQGFMLLEDLGDTTFAKVAIGDRQEYFYQKAI
ncbi:MAG TPA: aminoglycoside phosphotransferase, partial [Succinivibrio sp.]|nr:aminoglycoside phosphotransferase [Succinivibrio sp.]